MLLSRAAIASGGKFGGVMPQHAAREILWNPGVADFLKKLGARPDVIAFIENLEDTKLQGKLANEVRKRPGITVAELEPMAAKAPPKYHPLEVELVQMVVSGRAAENSAWAGWLLREIKKLRWRREDNGIWHHDFGDILQAPYGEYRRTHLSQLGVADVSLNPIFVREMIGAVAAIEDWVLAEEIEIASYSLVDALVATGEWHQQCSRLGGEYGPQDPKLIVYQFADGWRIVEVRTKNDLEAEG